MVGYITRRRVLVGAVTLLRSMPSAEKALHRSTSLVGLLRWWYRSHSVMWFSYENPGRVITIAMIGVPLVVRLDMNHSQGLWAHLGRDRREL